MPSMTYTKPNWGPLRRCLTKHGLEDFMGAFMYMGNVGPIQLYKHSLTRRYLNLDCAGKAYQYHGGAIGAPEYRRTPTKAALRALTEFEHA
jgi:hypothetical protein